MSFLTSHKVKFQALRKPSIGAGWKLGAMPVFAETKAMIGAGEPIMFVRAETEGTASVRTAIVRNNSVTFASKYHQGFTQELDSDGAVVDCIGSSYRMPACSQNVQFGFVDHRFTL